MMWVTMVTGVLLLRLCSLPSAFCAQQSSVVTQGQSTVQAFGGKIVSQNAVRFVLKDYDNDIWYHIDDQQKAGNFLGRYVLITGTFDGLTGTIRVRNIVVATPDEVSAVNAEKMKQNSVAAKSTAVPPVTSAPAPGAPQQKEPARQAAPSLEARMPAESDTPHHATTESSLSPARRNPARSSFLRLPEEAVSASSTVAISSRRSVPMPAYSAQGQPASNLVVGRLLRRISPSYPVEAKEQRIEGAVRLHALIGEDGSIQSIQPVSGAESLVAAAITAVREWRYGPTLVEGHRIQVEDDILLVFRLPN